MRFVQGRSTIQIVQSRSFRFARRYGEDLEEEGSNKEKDKRADREGQGDIEDAPESIRHQL